MVLTVIGAFLHGYEPETIFGRPAASMENVLRIGPWVCATIATLSVFVGHSQSDSASKDLIGSEVLREYYFNGDRADAKAIQSFPHVSAWLPFALSFGGWSVGIHVSPAETDAFSGWMFLIFAILIITIAGLLQVGQRHRRQQLYAIASNGIDTVGVVRKPTTYYDDDSPKTKVLVEFTDTVGVLRSAKANLAGHLPVGMKLKVR